MKENTIIEFLVDNMKQAFSLIELVVTLAIIALLLSVSLPTFRNYSYFNELERASESIISGLSETQTLSLAPPADKKTDYNCYGISFFPNSYQTLAGICQQGEMGPDQQQISSVLLPSNVALETSSQKVLYSLGDQGRIVFPKSQHQSNGEVLITLKHNRLKTSQNIKKVYLKIATGQVRVE